MPKFWTRRTGQTGGAWSVAIAAGTLRRRLPGNHIPRIPVRPRVRPADASIDDAIGPDQDRLRHRQAETAGGGGVERQPDAPDLLDRCGAGICALQDLVHEKGQALEVIAEARPVADEPAGFHEL